MITNLSLWVLRLTGGYLLLDDLKILNLPVHLEKMLYLFYAGFTLLKILVISGKIERAENLHRVIKTINWVIYTIIVAACLLEFGPSLTEFEFTSEVVRKCAYCLMMIALFIGSEKLLDIIIDARAERREIKWNLLKKFFRSLFPGKKTTGKVNPNKSRQTKRYAIVKQSVSQNRQSLSEMEDRNSDVSIQKEEENPEDSLHEEAEDNASHSP